MQNLKPEQRYGFNNSSINPKFAVVIFFQNPGELHFSNL